MGRISQFLVTLGGQLVYDGLQRLTLLWSLLVFTGIAFLSAKITNLPVP